MSAEHLPPPRAEVHLRRVLPVHRHAKRRAAGVDAPVEPLPAVAQVGGAHHAALLAAEVHPHAGVQRVGVGRIPHHAPGILDVGEPAEVAVLPGRALVRAAPHAGAVGNQHRAGVRAAHGHAVQIQQVNIAGELAVADGPGMPAIHAAGRAAHFQRRVHIVGVAGLNVDAQDAHRKGHLHLLRVGHRGEVRPVFAAVRALENLGPLGAGEHNAGVIGMEPQRPDHAALGHIHPLPAVAAVGAAIDAPLGAAKDGARVVGVDGDGPRLRGRGQPVGEQIPVGIAGRLAIESAGLGANVHDSAACHSAGLLLLCLVITMAVVLARISPDRRADVKRNPADSKGETAICQKVGCALS